MARTRSHSTHGYGSRSSSSKQHLNSSSDASEAESQVNPADAGSGMSSSDESGIGGSVPDKSRSSDLGSEPDSQDSDSDQDPSYDSMAAAEEESGSDDGSENESDDESDATSAADPGDDEVELPVAFVPTNPLDKDGNVNLPQLAEADLHEVEAGIQSFHNRHTPSIFAEDIELSELHDGALHPAEYYRQGIAATHEQNYRRTDYGAGTLVHIERVEYYWRRSAVPCPNHSHSGQANNTRTSTGIVR